MLGGRPSTQQQDLRTTEQAEDLRSARRPRTECPTHQRSFGSAGAHADADGDTRRDIGRLPHRLQTAFLTHRGLQAFRVELPTPKQPLHRVTCGTNGAAFGQLEIQILNGGFGAPAWKHTGIALLRGTVQRAQQLPGADDVLLRAEDRQDHSDGECGVSEEQGEDEGVD